MKNKELTVKLAMKLIKNFEGFEARAYPDPASELYKQLSKDGILASYLQGSIVELPEKYSKLSGAPWTIGYGETKGVKQGDVWTAVQAEEALATRIEGFLSEVLKTSPKLALESPERVSAIVSLVYNIGITNYKGSTVAREIANGNHVSAAQAILLWNKAGKPLQVMQGLVRRRQAEKDMYMAVRG